ncbi:MAG: ABC transporter permease [Capsulimonadaceae bacterium]|nr:ABC transporter permease [Capsulimonadaceae bacterium]
MRTLLTIAELTLREALRRKFAYAGLLICAFFILAAYIPIHPRQSLLLPDIEPNDLVAGIMASRGSSMISFFAFLFAVTLAAGSISGEIERGVIAVIVSKPIARTSVYLGKWLGVNLFVLPFVVLWTAILQWAIARHTGHAVPGLWRADAAMALYPAIFSAMTLTFSAITSTMMATILPLVLASVAWSEGMLRFFGRHFDVQSLTTAANVVVYVAPLNPLSRWVERLIDLPVIERVAALMRMGEPPDPPAGALDMAWIAAYGLAMLIVGAWVFARRDLSS